MLYGTVKYTLRANPEGPVEVPWAGRVVFGEEGKMKFYQVYLVSFSLFLLSGVYVVGRWEA